MMMMMVMIMMVMMVVKMMVVKMMVMMVDDDGNVKPGPYLVILLSSLSVTDLLDATFSFKHIRPFGSKAA